MESTLKIAQNYQKQLATIEENITAIEAKINERNQLQTKVDQLSRYVESFESNSRDLQKLKEQIETWIPKLKKGEVPQFETSIPVKINKNKQPKTNNSKTSTSTEVKQVAKPKTISNERYQVSPEGVIYDSTTNLEWYVGSDKDTSWDQAIEWVSNLNVAGGGWRMPTIKKLAALYEEGKGSRNIDPVFQISGWWVWSGELCDEKGNNNIFIENNKNNKNNHLPSVRNFSFYGGSGSWGNRSHVINGRVFGVRSGRRHRCKVKHK